MKKDLLLPLLAMALAVLTACDRKETVCPAFPASEEEWLPYQVGDVLNFQSDTLVYSMPVEEVSISEEQFFTRDWGYPCTPTMYVFTGLDLQSWISVSATISYQDGDIEPGYLPLHVRITAYEQDVIDLMEVGRDDFDCDPQGMNWTLNGDTLVIRNEDPTIFEQITMVRGEGLVSAIAVAP